MIYQIYLTISIDIYFFTEEGLLIANFSVDKLTNNCILESYDNVKYNYLLIYLLRLF